MSSQTRRLDQLGQHGKGVITVVGEDDQEVVKYLATLGLMADIEVVVEEVGPFNGPLLLRVGESRYALGRDMAARILVKESV